MVAVEIDVYPLALAAAVYALHRLWMRYESEAKPNACGEEIVSEPHVQSECLPEPCAEPDESEDEGYREQASARGNPPKLVQSSRRSLVAPASIGVLLVAALAVLMCVYYKEISPYISDLVSKEQVRQTKVVTMRLARQRVPVRKNGKLLYHKNAYVADLTAGTPSATFQVVIDTGSGHLILPSSYCRSPTCRAHRRYKRSASSSAVDYDFDGNVVAEGSPRDQITVNFGTGEVSGIFIEDVFCLQDFVKTGAALTPRNTTTPAGECTRMRFIAATDMSDDPFSEFQFDGVLGLGLAGLSQGPEFNFLNVMSESGGVFALFLAEGSAEESSLSLGGWDKTILDDQQPRWTPVHKPELGHWMVRLLGIRVTSVGGNKSMNHDVRFCKAGDCRAVLDTGTSVLAVPTSSFAEIFSVLKHPVPTSGSCVTDEGPALHFDIDAAQDHSDRRSPVTLTLTPRDFARLDKKAGIGSSRTETSCKPMMMTMDLAAPLGPRLFILGEPVLKRFYTIFDSEKRRIGFGNARVPTHANVKSMVK